MISRSARGTTLTENAIATLLIKRHDKDWNRDHLLKQLKFTYYALGIGNVVAHNIGCLHRRQRDSSHLYFTARAEVLHLEQVVWRTAHISRLELKRNVI